MLTVDVLGPLRVSVGGRQVELPAGRLHVLLAVLAMSAGRAVATDTLATAVWGTDPRGVSRANVRTNIKRLRAAMGSLDGQLIVARSGGYLLSIEPEQIDALRFGILLDEAAAAQHPAAERSRLEAALALWRGAPFEGIRSDWLDHSIAPALQERYLSAVERRTDLNLAEESRRYPAESPDSSSRVDLTQLADLAEQHPLRESLWVRLLRVLESAGRPAEALERYETIRLRLADELGADPSPQLQQAHKELLAGGAQASTRVTPRHHGARMIPRQLPPAFDGFAGRRSELAALDALVEPPSETPSRSPLITVIAGTAGVGKTTLAVHWAHRIARHFPDGQLYVNLRGYDPSGQSAQPAAVIREFLDALHVPQHEIPDSPTARAGLYHSLLAERRMLVLLDNARDTNQVAPLLPAAPGCLIVITSRDHLTGLVMTYGARPVTLDLLPPDEARHLLASRLGHERVDAEPTASEEIVRRCAGLPLALAIVAARAAIQPGYPLGALATELRDVLGALSTGGDADVRAIFSWSYETLSDPAARLFRLVAGLHPGPDSTVTTAASLAGVPVSQARGPMAELTRANLLTEYAPGRHSCHDLLRAYATELTTAHDADRDAARERIVDHYVHTAHAATLHLHGHIETVAPSTIRPDVSVTNLAGPDEAMAWFRAERPALLASLELAADLGLDRHVGDLARALFVFLHRHGHWQDRAETQRAAVAAAQRLDDPVEESRALRNLAWALADMGRFDDAHDTLDAALARSHEDLTAEAWTHYYRDLVFATEGREADALNAARRAHDLFDQLGDQKGRAIALTNLGWHHGRLGHGDRAVDLCEQALVLHQKLGNRQHETHTWSCLADTHLRLGEPARAIPCYRQALDMFREFGDLFGEASTLAHLGACHRLGGDDATARACWRRAHSLLGELDLSTIDQIHTQLATIDTSSANAFRHHQTSIA
ncbi:AfsR/SARP family transcriptional regulator [Phytoactinopolyspora limicola]|uniref:AfsR/SARP family transcriptional regulator n=1 Tax=Phytoactinopolyspora limicola TaxID=2715536 RepID=UPI00140D6631|nr:BTAD domain-containing putative transcriptional regulator [Phytoactinopolyspora limicola]